MNVSLDLDDRQSKKILRNMREAGRYASNAEMVRAALRLLRTLHEQANAGFIELIMRNPENGEQQLVSNWRSD